MASTRSRSWFGFVVLALVPGCASVPRITLPYTVPVSDFLGADTAFIQAAVPSGDGRRLGILTTDGTVLVWQLAPHRLLGRWFMPGPPIVNQSNGTFPMALDEAGEHLAIASTDAHVRVWQVDPPLALGGFVPTPPGTVHVTRRRQPGEHGESVMDPRTTRFGPMAAQALAFPPGRFRLTAAGYRGVSTWDLRSMSPLDSTAFVDVNGSFEPAMKLAYAPSGMLLVGTQDGDVRRLNPRTDTEDWRVNYGVGNPSALVTSPWGALFAVAGMRDSNVVVARVGDGTVVCRQRVGALSKAVFSQEYGLLLVESSRALVVINTKECRSLRAPVTGMHLSAGIWFDATCEHAFLASRVSRAIRVYALPRTWRC